MWKLLLPDPDVRYPGFLKEFPLFVKTNRLNLVRMGRMKTFDPSHPPLVNHTTNTCELALIPAFSRQDGRMRKILGSICVGELPLSTQSLRWKSLTKAQRKLSDNLRYTW